MSIAGTKFRVNVEVKTRVFPRDAREQLGKWKLFSSEHRAKGEHFLVAADEISPGARELLVEQGVGYFEPSGGFCLPFPGAYIFIDPPAASRSERAVPAGPGSRLDLFTEARVPVLHAMLLAPDENCSVQKLAYTSGVSAATVSKLLTSMELEEWVESTGAGPSKTRRLIKPGHLLDAWAQFNAQREARGGPGSMHDSMKRLFVPSVRKTAELLLVVREAFNDVLRNSSEAGDGLADYLLYVPSGQNMLYQVTAEAAAAHYAPFLTNWPALTLRAYPGVADYLVRFLTQTKGAKEVQQGANLQLVHNDLSSLRLVHNQDVMTYASPVQTYLDLLSQPGRAADAARHLREQVLKY